MDAPTEAAWLAARSGVLTASDVAAVMGLDPHKSRNKVLAGKRATASDTFVTSAMRGGQFLEPGVFGWYLDDIRRHNAEMGLPPPDGNTCRHPGGASMLVTMDGHRLGASPDGLVVDCGVPHLVEIKVTNPDRWDDSWGVRAVKTPRAWRRYSSVESPAYGKCPLKHWVQLQTQMLVTGVSSGVIVGNCGTRRLDYPFRADPAFQRSILEACDEFWRDVPLTLPDDDPTCDVFEGGK